MDGGGGEGGRRGNGGDEGGDGRGAVAEMPKTSHCQFAVGTPAKPVSAVFSAWQPGPSWTHAPLGWELLPLPSDQ